jgi:hypothetical protein
MAKADTTIDAGATGRTRADTPPNPSRRGLLAGSTAAVLVASAAAVTAVGAPRATVSQRQDADGTDAELLALCAAFHEEHAAANAPGTEEVCEAALARRWDISDDIQDIPATTEAGRRAKAAVGVVLLQENRGDEYLDEDVEFAMAALRDIAGIHVP